MLDPTGKREANIYKFISNLKENIRSEQFILNATEADYLRYSLNSILDSNRSGIINVKEDVVKNGTVISSNRLINPPIRVVEGGFNPGDFNKILAFISNNYQKLITVTRYHVVA